MRAAESRSVALLLSTALGRAPLLLLPLLLVVVFVLLLVHRMLVHLVHGSVSVAFRSVRQGLRLMDRAARRCLRLPRHLRRFPLYVIDQIRHTIRYPFSLRDSARAGPLRFPFTC